MARGKKKGGKKGRDEGSDNDDNVAAAATEEPKLSRKQKREQKQNKKQQHQQDDDDDDDDDLAHLIGGGAAMDNSDDDDSDEDDAAPPVSKKAAKKRGNNNKKQQPPAAAGLAALSILGGDDSSSENSSKEEATESKRDEDDDDDDGEVEQVAMVLADDWDDDKKKSKKKKKEKKLKKEKKHKKEKKKKKETQDHDGSGTDEEDDEHKEEAAAAAPKPKSKFELQMEAAMKKKEASGTDVAKPDDSDNKKKKASQALKELEPEPDWVDTNNQNDNDDDNDDDDQIMYGAPDDHAWNDKSHAVKESEDANDKDPKKSLLYGPDGKKLSNKERKRLLKAQQAAERAAEYEQTAAAASKEGAQFACSQTAVTDLQWEQALDIKIPSFSISAAGKILFQNATLTIGHGRRYGLVGPNGKGKSTLLKMIASRDLVLPPRIDFLYVEQEVTADDTPAVEAVLRADERRWTLLQQEAELMKLIDNGNEDPETIDQLQTVLAELTAMGADAAEAKARRILYGLGFGLDMQTKPTKMFSGGWRMRISLARALFVEPTLLMLDEPTNHLDLNAVIWLDEYLQKWKKTLLVVSHDQDFLNSVCQEILHIEDLKLCSYKGNYDSFKKAEHTKFLQQIKAYEKQEKRLRELKKGGQSKAKAQEMVKKQSNKRESGARAQKKKNQDIAAGTDTAEQAELIKRPKEYQVKLEFVEVADLSRPVIEVNNVHFRYSPKHPVIFDCIDFGIDMDSRVCIVGPNGAGKSTLLKLLTGELNPTTGEIKRNPRLRMGIYNQHFVERLPMNKTPVEHLRDRFEDETYQSVRNRLGRYGLEGHAHEVTMRDLSGGQKARVVFVELSLQEPHVLLLDEPTNNLDIETIDALCDAVNEFNGGIVVVTHDQRLIEECDCTLWVVEKQGVTRWDAGFDDYKETILQELEAAVEKEAAIRRKKLEEAAAAKAEKIAKLAQKHKKK